ncbi:MAG: Protein required for ethanol metabolism [Cyphobasidiales sp. Tagirdzhanova-0007]|nr:MAG: Protein required for ethanol metabolism [Cyphobasidiales sp. Tagirdzhanova-0007]
MTTACAVSTGRSKAEPVSVPQAAVLFGAGDILAQQGVEKKGLRNHDLVRTARLSLYGGAVFAPLLMPWFKALERIHLKSRVLTTLARVGADQFIAAPVLVGIFFTAMPVMEGKPQDIRGRLAEKWQPTLFKNWMLTLENRSMSIVPPPLRLLVVNVVSLFWNTYLSWANSAGAAQETIKSK